MVSSRRSRGEEPFASLRQGCWPCGRGRLVTSGTGVVHIRGHGLKLLQENLLSLPGLFPSTIQSTACRWVWERGCRGVASGTRVQPQLEAGKKFVESARDARRGRGDQPLTAEPEASIHPMPLQGTSVIPVRR